MKSFGLKTLPAAILTLVTIWAASSLAQKVAAEDAAAEQVGRYTMSPADGGFLRLDRQTGAVAFCTRKGDQWSCAAALDTARASDDTLKSLEDENKRLKEEIDQLKSAAAPAPLDGPAPDIGGPPGGKLQLPTEQEVDKALDYMENIFKKFRDRMRKFDTPPVDDKSGTL